jgi:hypothetical protein
MFWKLGPSVAMLRGSRICKRWVLNGIHHLKWSKPGSESQRLHVLSHMWNIDPIQIQAILWKTGHAKRRSLKREGGLKKENKEENIVEDWCTSYIRMNIEFLNCWNHRKKGIKVERIKIEGINQFGL